MLRLTGLFSAGRRTRLLSTSTPLCSTSVIIDSLRYKSTSICCKLFLFRKTLGFGLAIPFTASALALVMVAAFLLVLYDLLADVSTIFLVDKLTKYAYTVSLQ